MFWISHARIYTFWSLILRNVHKIFSWLYSKFQINITWKFHCFDITGCQTMCKIKGGSEFSIWAFNTALSGCFFRVLPSYFLAIFLCSGFYLIQRHLHDVFLCKTITSYAPWHFRKKWIVQTSAVERWTRYGNSNPFISYVLFVD